MDILISFSASVGVVNSFRMAKDLSIYIVNQSIVLSLKNKKIPNPGQSDRPLNSREVNKRTPPYLGVGKYAYIYSSGSYYKYRFNQISWNYSHEEKEGTEVGYEFTEIWAGVVWIHYSFPSSGGGGGGLIQRIPASSYSPVGNTASYSEIDNRHDGSLSYPPVYDGEGNLIGGFPPGYMIGEMRTEWKISQRSVSFGD